MVRGAEVDGVRVLTRIAEEVTMEPVDEVDGRRTPILQERENVLYWNARIRGIVQRDCRISGRGDCRVYNAWSRRKTPCESRWR